MSNALKIINEHHKIFFFKSLHSISEAFYLVGGRGILSDITGDSDIMAGQEQNLNQILKSWREPFIKQFQILKMIKLRLRESMGHLAN